MNSVAAGELLRDNATVTAWTDSNIEAVLTHETVAAADRKVDGSRVRAPRVSSIIDRVTSRGQTDRTGGQGSWPRS